MEFDTDVDGISFESLYGSGRETLEHAHRVNLICDDIRAVMTLGRELQADVPFRNVLKNLHFVEAEIQEHQSEIVGLEIELLSKVEGVLEPAPEGEDVYFGDHSESRIISSEEDRIQLIRLRNDLRECCEQEREQTLEVLFSALAECFDRQALAMLEDEDLNQSFARNFARQIFDDVEADSGIEISIPFEEFEPRVSEFLRMDSLSEGDMEPPERFGELKHQLIRFFAWLQEVGGDELAHYFRSYFNVDWDLDNIRYCLAPMDNYWRLQMLLGKQRRDLTLESLRKELAIEEDSSSLSAHSQWNRAIKNKPPRSWRSEQYRDNQFGKPLTLEAIAEYGSEFSSLSHLVRDEKEYRSVFSHDIWLLAYNAMKQCPELAETFGEAFWEENDRMIMQAHRNAIISSDPVKRDQGISCGYTMFNLGTANPEVGAEHASVLILNAYRQIGHSGGFPYQNERGTGTGSRSSHLGQFLQSLDAVHTPLPEWLRSAKETFDENSDVLLSLYYWDAFRETMWNEKEIAVPLLPPEDWGGAQVQALIDQLPENKRGSISLEPTDEEINAIRSRVRFLEHVYQGCVEFLNSEREEEVIFGLQTMQYLDFPMTEDTYQVIADFLDQREVFSPRIRRAVVNLGHRSDYFSNALALRCMVEFNPESDHQDDSYDIPRILLNLATMPEHYPKVASTLAAKLGISDLCAVATLGILKELADEHRLTLKIEEIPKLTALAAKAEPFRAFCNAYPIDRWSNSPFDFRAYVPLILEAEDDFSHWEHADIFGILIDQERSQAIAYLKTRQDYAQMGWQNQTCDEVDLCLNLNSLGPRGIAFFQALSVPESGWREYELDFFAANIARFPNGMRDSFFTFFEDQSARSLYLGSKLLLRLCLHMHGLKVGENFDQRYVDLCFSLLGEPDFVRRLDRFTPEAQTMVAEICGLLYSIDPEIVLPFMMQIGTREQSVAKLKLIKTGLHKQTPESPLTQHVIAVAQTRPKVAYDLFTSSCLADPVLDDAFWGDIGAVVSPPDSADFLPQEIREVIDSFDLLDDSEVLQYCQYKGWNQNLDEKGCRKAVKALRNGILKTKKAIRSAEREVGEQSQLRLEAQNQKLELSLIDAKTAAFEGTIKIALFRSISSILEAEGMSVEERSLDTLDLTEDLINAILIYHKSSTNKSLFAQLIRDHVAGHPTRAWDRPENEAKKEQWSAVGINVDTWIKGVDKEYPVRISNNRRAILEQNIGGHQDTMLTLCQKYEIQSSLETLDAAIEEFLAHDGVSEEDLLDFRTQVQAVEELRAELDYDVDQSQVSGTIRIYTEGDPFKILQMGNVVPNSCLGTDKGNAWSTAENAAGINKRVLYMELNGSIIGRKLIAINDDNQMVQFQTFTNRFDIDVDGLFQDHLQLLLSETNLSSSDGGVVSQLVGDRWYNDGIVRFPSDSDPDYVPSVVGPDSALALSA